jgi:hypothetical protein
MGQHINPLARLLPGPDRLDHRKTVLTDALVDRDVLLGNLAGAGTGLARPGFPAIIRLASRR